MTSGKRDPNSLNDTWTLAVTTKVAIQTNTLPQIISILAHLRTRLPKQALVNFDPTRPAKPGQPRWRLNLASWPHSTWTELVKSENVQRFPVNRNATEAPPPSFLEKPSIWNTEQQQQRQAGDSEDSKTDRKVYHFIWTVFCFRVTEQPTGQICLIAVMRGLGWSIFLYKGLPKSIIWTDFESFEPP